MILVGAATKLSLKANLTSKYFGMETIIIGWFQASNHVARNCCLRLQFASVCYIRICMRMSSQLLRSNHCKQWIRWCLQKTLSSQLAARRRLLGLRELVPVNFKSLKGEQKDTTTRSVRLKGPLGPLEVTFAKTSCGRTCCFFPRF